ncbi:MAG: DUF4190 domain-containing protein [Phycisphaeraceae bacterium]
MSDFNAPVDQAGSQKSTSRLATAALICAVIGLSPLLLLIGFPPPVAIGILASPLALILSIIALLPRTPKPGRSKSRAITAIVISSLTIMCFAFFFYLQYEENANFRRYRLCPRQMTQTVMAMMSYAIRNDNQFPPDLNSLVKTGAIPPSYLFCPRADPHGAESDYIYVRPAAGLQATDDTILLYEPLHNHRGEGMNIAFADGLVVFINATAARSLLEKQGLKVVE